MLAHKNDAGADYSNSFCFGVNLNAVEDIGITNNFLAQTSRSACCSSALRTVRGRALSRGTLLGSGLGRRGRIFVGRFGRAVGRRGGLAAGFRVTRRTVNHDRLFGSYGSIDYEHSSVSQVIALQTVPAPQTVGRHAKIIRNRSYGVTCADSVMGRLPGVSQRPRSGDSAHGDRDNNLAFGAKLLTWELINPPNRSRSGVVLPRNAVQRVAGVYMVISPGDAFIQRDRRNRMGKFLLRSGGKTEVVDGILGRS